MLSRAWLSRQLRPTGTVLEKYGNGAEAWYVPAEIPAGSIAYCGGVGNDASYDFALVERKHCRVFSFDPTPLAVAYMERENHGRVEYKPWGLLDSDRTISFYAPLDPTHTSWFAENLHNSSTKIDAECRSLRSIMGHFGHDRLDLLKIDIEGSWFGVLHQMLKDGIFPGTVCVEFDSPAPLWRVRSVTRALQANGYKLVLRENDNAVFLRET